MPNVSIYYLRPWIMAESKIIWNLWEEVKIKRKIHEVEKVQKNKIIWGESHKILCLYNKYFQWIILYLHVLWSKIQHCYVT